MYYQNPQIENLVRVFDQNDRSGFLRLDLNENPVGLPKEIVEEVLNGITSEDVAKYPETKHFTEVLARFLGTDQSHLCLVNGSAEGIRYIIQAFTSEKGRIVGVTPSYFMFQVYAEMYNRKWCPVPYESDLTMNISNIIQELTEETQLLVLLNPNNPMGNTYSDIEFEQLMQVAKAREITVLVDEAYHYFYPKTFIKYALNTKHVFVTRTFSKLCSIAGCRLGYVVGWSEGITLVQKLCTPHNTNVFALRFAEKVLTTPGLIQYLVDVFNEGRQTLLMGLDNSGYQHQGNAGNFQFIKPKTSAKKIVERMKLEKKILIKSYSNIGQLGDCLRVTIGDKKSMLDFLCALTELDC